MPASTRVLLVDHDVDALAELAGVLRERGIKVSLANGSQMACERAKTGSFDVVVAARDVAEPEDGNLGVMDALSVELPQVPPLLVLIDDDSAGGANGNESRIGRRNVDKIVERIGELSRPATLSSERPRHPSLVPSTHSLEHAPLADLLVVLATERRSGTLTVTTSKGSGEVRIVEGEVADAVYVRLEGLKAITRMLSEREGTATFAPGAPAIMRRIHTPTRALVDEARTLADQADQLRKKCGSLARETLIATDGGAAIDSTAAVDQHVLARLRVPATLDELLDELPHADATILEATLSLDAKGRIKQLGHFSSRVQLCGADQLHLVRASAARAKTAGYAGATRLVFAATASRLAVLGHTVLSLADAFPPADPTPPLPVPHSLSTIRLGDGVELDVMALPLVPAYAPLWPMALAGAAVAVRLDDGAAQPLEEACGCVGVTILDARAVFGAVDESSPVQVASLIRTALEADPGG
jgi:CheY-like chemotaxis protein